MVPPQTVGGESLLTSGRCSALVHVVITTNMCPILAGVSDSHGLKEAIQDINHENRAAADGFSFFGLVAYFIFACRWV